MNGQSRQDGSRWRWWRRVEPTSTLLIALSAVIVGAGSAGATIGYGSAINGCVVPNSSRSSEVDILQVGQTCPTDATSVQWNQPGITGATGASGAPGPTGPPGPAGLAGYTVTASALPPLVTATTSQTTFADNPPPEQLPPSFSCPKGYVPLAVGWHINYNSQTSLTEMVGAYYDRNALYYSVDRTGVHYDLLGPIGGSYTVAMSSTCLRTQRPFIARLIVPVPAVAGRATSRPIKRGLRGPVTVTVPKRSHLPARQIS